MDFNIRAIVLTDCAPADARVEVGSLLGKRIEFRAGFGYAATLPIDQDQFARVPEPERFFAVLENWSRVYGYRHEGTQRIHVLAPAELETGQIAFYRLDLSHVIKSGKGPRPPIQIMGGLVMEYDECVDWLIETAFQWEAYPSQRNLRFVIRRPNAIDPIRIRVAWVVPSSVEGQPIHNRLKAIGKAFGVEIVHVEPRGYRDTAARLAKLAPYDAAVICRRYAPHVTADAFPSTVRQDLIHFCDSENLLDLEMQMRTWIEVAVDEVQNASAQEPDEEKFLMALMLRAMLSHSKIGESLHCPKETVLKVIRGRKLNVPRAERLVDDNSEEFHATKASASLFLWKAHNDGRQYFLNPRRVEEIRVMAAGAVPIRP